MAETVKKSRIVSEDDLEETLMEEFNLRLKSCLSQDHLEIAADTDDQQNLYENLRNQSQLFIETERREQETNGHYENVAAKTDDYMDMERNGTAEYVKTEEIYEEVEPLRTENDADSTPSVAVYKSASVDIPDKVEPKSVKDRMFLATDDAAATLLFTQTVTSPMLTPSEENVDFLKGFRTEPEPKSQEDEEQLYENVAPNEVQPQETTTNGNGALEDDEDITTELSDPCSLDRQVSDSEAEPRQSDFRERILLDFMEDVGDDTTTAAEVADDKSTRIVDEIVKGYATARPETNATNREKDTESVPPKIVQNLTSQFMKNGDDKDENASKKPSDVNHLKSVDIMKQINKFEQKDEDNDSTQITESYTETTAFDSNVVGEKTMKKKKSKKSRKEEKENISVKETNNLETFYNVNVKILCRSFGDLRKIDDKRKTLHPEIRYMIDRTKEKFNVDCSYGMDGDKNSALGGSCRNLASMKSSFSKFDALQKKNLLHIRSSDSTKAQEKFNGAIIDASNCKCCGKQVFQMEQIKAEKAIWHKNCFRCHECGKQLNVDTYESHEGTLYCKPHFKALFAPKVVEDGDEPPSDKPDLGLEELQRLNVKERFQVFEQHQNNETALEKTQINVKRSPSILSKLAKFQSKGMDIGVADESLNGIPIEESSSDEEDEEEEEIPEGEDPDLVRAKRVQKEKPFHFTGMSDVKNKWEQGDSNGRDERREERKQEIQSIRNKLFMGKQGKMKEAYQEAVMKSETSVNLRKEEIQVGDTKTIKERFEKGEIAHETTKDDKDDEEQEVYESEISKKSRSLFLQLDANASKPPNVSLAAPPKLEVKKAREAYIQKSASQDTVKCTEQVDDVTVRTADIQQRFKFFETYREPEKRRKEFRITPPREGQVKGATPERDLYHDPDIVRADETVEDSVIAKETHTATKMLNKFRQMEENLSKESAPQGPKPLKCFTPPPEPAREESSSEEGSESEEEEEQIDAGKLPDDDLLEAQKAARAKQLRAKFEKWEAQEIKREQNNSTINILEEYGEEQSQIESTKLLRARFESMKETHSEVKQPRVKVNRFV